MVALDKQTGKIRWTLDMPTYAWPSPVDVYDKDGNAYIIECDHNGSLLLIDGLTGKLIQKQKIDSYLEASPAVFNNYLIFASRTGKVYGFKIK
jgi:outer membrane protein assembly factor BamB